MATANIEFTTTEYGRGALLVNGNDISRYVSCVELIAEAGQVARVRVTFSPAAVKFSASAIAEFIAPVIESNGNGEMFHDE